MKISDRVVVGVIAFVARWFVVVWAAKRIPPTADGTYYHLLATRIAEGHGYTWLWPDGAVTYAAHYPVGYPALVALPYAIFGAKPIVAMAVNALLGIAAALAVHDMLVRSTSRALARMPVIVPLTAVVILATAATHAVFFGSGRYGLVVLPFVTALAFQHRWRDPLALRSA